MHYHLDLMHYHLDLMHYHLDLMHYHLDLMHHHLDLMHYHLDSVIILIILIILILCTIILRKISQHLYIIIGQSNLLLCVVFVDLVATKLKQVSSTCQIGRVASAGALAPEPPRATRSPPRRR